MKVYSSNGTLIHSSSFPDGFVAEKKGGNTDFKTTIRNPELKELIANVTFVDLEKDGALSNTVTSELNLQESDISSTATSTQDNEDISPSDTNADAEEEGGEEE